MNSARFRCPSLVGRTEEFNTLLALGQAAQRGHGGLVLVGGEAGIGKTRLVQACFDTLPGATASVVNVACYDAARAPLAPILDAIRFLDSETRSTQAAPSSISWLLDPAAQPMAAQSATSRRDHFFAIVHYLRTHAEQFGAFVCIEDVHWADAQTLELLRFLAARIADLPMLIVLTYRQSELAATAFSSWYTAITRMPGVQSLLLKPLGSDDMIVFIDEATRGHGALPGRLRRQIRLRADGNPLFAEELLQHALSGSPDDSLPITLQAILLQRLDGFDETQRGLFECAAAFAPAFTAEHLAAVSGRRITTVEAALRIGRDHGLVIESAERPDAWSFRHNLIRESIYNALPRSTAARFHVRIAQRLETDLAESSNVLALAYHWSRAGETQKSARYCEEAGDRAMILCASADAVDLYERALRATGAADARRTALLTKLGTSLVFAGSPKRARSAFEEAMARAIAAGDPAAIAEIALRLARCYSNDNAARDAIACLQNALAILGADVAERSSLLASLGWMQAVLGESNAAGETLERFEAVDARASDGARIEALDARGTALAHQWRSAASLDAYRAAAHLAQTNAEHDPRWAVRAYANFAEVAGGLGSVELAVEAADAAVRIVRGWAISAGVPFVLAIASRVHLRGGHIGLANALFVEADVLAIEAESARLSGHLAMCAFALCARLIDAPLSPRYEPDVCLSEALASEEAAWIGGVAGAIVEWHAVRGDLKSVRSVLSRTFDRLTSIALSYELVLGALLHGDPEHRASATALLASVPAGGSALNRALASIRTAYEPGRSATVKRAALQAAAAQFSTAGMPYEEGCTLELAQDLRGAVGAYRRAGSSAHVARLGAVAGATVRRAGADLLTRRECEVAALVTSGASNRLIAERIGLSERTVEAHLRSIFAKLDVRSRYELMARVLDGHAIGEVAIG